MKAAVCAQEICLSDSPVVMTLVDGPTEESDNLICVAYRHQFDVVNESTGEAFRLHHVEANRVRQPLEGQPGEWARDGARCLHGVSFHHLPLSMPVLWVHSAA